MIDKVRKPSNSRLIPKLINYMKKLINLRDHCPPESVHRQTIADPSKVTPGRNAARSYAAVATSGSAHTASPPKEFADRGITLDAASAVPSPKKTLLVSKLSPTERRQPLMPLW
jgi:hypothetical protein